MGNIIKIKGANFDFADIYGEWEDCSSEVTFVSSVIYTGALHGKKKVGVGAYNYFTIPTDNSLDRVEDDRLLSSNFINVKNVDKIRVTIPTSTTTTFGVSLVVFDDDGNLLLRVVANEHSYKGTMLAEIVIPEGASYLSFATWNPVGENADIAARKVYLYKKYKTKNPSK